MIPPTPTPMPIGTPVPLNLDSAVSLWGMAPDAVGLWNQFGSAGTVLQWLIIGALAVALWWFVSSLIKRLSEDEA